ncbi:hypothetical protein BJM58_12260 [Listeria monocytogenes]|uniref:3'-5' exonuclease n=1 Tax=Listeria monocytogenes TaxID=1639 RepID=UPI0008749CB7|nr:3'-5' exonuclease [Listeria monocytogenes]EGA0596979.1 UvrD-helicase domain-containing protein [Listeria monocytogenes]OFG34050.1 hypothetical protein BJM58_12260 [Listeria monocytogenes]
MVLPKPEGKQNEVLYLPDIGNIVVLGTAGSGKTTIALLRAVRLAITYPDEKILLLTYNRTLINYMEFILSDKPQNLVIENYHKFARGYLNSRGKMGYKCILTSKNDLIKEAVDTVKKIYPNETTLERHIEVFIDEIEWIQKMGISDKEEYIKVERAGRSDARILRKNRCYFYEVFQKYIEFRNERGYLYDWDSLATGVCKEASQDKKERLYKYILIDEGQDFSPTMLKSLSLLIPNEGSINFFGDVAQQIYGSRISWRSAGLSNVKIWKLEKNYRNKSGIGKLAKAISELPFFEIDEVDKVNSVVPIAEGPKPIIIRLENEIDFVANYVKASDSTRTIAILLKTREDISRVERNFAYRGIEYTTLKKDMGEWSESDTVYIGTYHSAKGLEFDIVIMPFMSDKCMPTGEEIEKYGSKDDALSELVKLMYVSVTRAKAGVIITYSDELTDLLPKDKNLYDWREENDRL